MDAVVIGATGFIGRWLVLELARANRTAERAVLRGLLAASPVPVRLVAGERDPLVQDAGDAPVTTVAGAGHSLHITHPDAVASAVLGLRVSN